VRLLEMLKEINKTDILSKKTVLKIICKDGVEINGRYQAYVSELDNEPEEAQLDIITLDTEASVGLLESEIETIEVLNN